MTLKDFFEKYNRVALGFSGGVDSSYLLWAAVHYGAKAGVYYVSTAFQPEFERRDAIRLARSLGIDPVILEVDIIPFFWMAPTPVMTLPTARECGR